MLKKLFLDFKNFFIKLDLACKYLILILIMTLPIICISSFIQTLDASGNLVTLRTIFSSIAGYILEKSTCTSSCDTNLTKNKIFIIGTFSLICIVVIIFASFLESNVNNPSLVLIKNLLFSSVGFLISATENKD